MKVTRFGLAIVWLVLVSVLCAEEKEDIVTTPSAVQFNTSLSRGVMFRVDDVQLVGLNAVGSDRVFAALGMDITKPISYSEVARAIKNIYALGFFLDVRAYKQHNKIFFLLKERDIIYSIDASGNKLIPKEALIQSLADRGVEAGNVFSVQAINNILAGVRVAYEDKGYFNADIKVETSVPKEGYVEINLKVDENSKIALENIIFAGNKALSDDDLLDVMKLQSRGYFQILINSYDSFQFEADLRAIRSLYLSNGYLEAEILSSEVKVAPDEKSLYIIIEIIEGSQYSIRDVNISGKYILPKSFFDDSLQAMKGQAYDEGQVEDTKNRFVSELRNMGYINAEVSVEKQLDKQTTEVDLNFVVQPNRKHFVRYIRFIGNTTTADYVLRREMRQYENSVVSASYIQLSKSRLNRLGYFKSVAINPVVVSPGLVDLEVVVEEQKRQSVSANLSYSTNLGLAFGAQYSTINILGTGQDVSTSLSIGQSANSANISHYMPAAFDSRYSLRSSLFYYRSKSDNNVTNTEYSRERDGLSVALGYAISENQRIEYGTSIEHSRIIDGENKIQEIELYKDVNGSDYLDVVFNITHTYNSLNLGFLPTNGWYVKNDVEFVAPFSNNKFYILSAKAIRYTSIIDGGVLTWRLKGEARYGNSYGNTKYFPFYRYFNSGGLTNVRGYEYAGIGPRSKQEEDGALSSSSFGGNVFLQSTTGLIFANESMLKSNVRASIFFDVGNVFNTNCIIEHEGCSNGVDLSELRASYGLGFVWYTAIAPLTLFYAIPVNSKTGDDLERLQFSVGVSDF